MTFAKVATQIAKELIRKSGVKEWTDPEQRAAIINAAIEFAYAFTGYLPSFPMAINATFRQQAGTAKTFKSSGGDAAISMASVANAAGRQSIKLDLGATFGQLIRVRGEFEIAATPTAGATIDLYWAPSSSGTAGTDNPANVSGTDAAYAGYSSNLTASLKQLVFIGSFVCTAQATATVQKGEVGTFRPTHRYGSLVVVNNSGASIHSSDSNVQIVFTPLEETSEA